MSRTKTNPLEYFQKLVNFAPTILEKVYRNQDIFVVRSLEKVKAWDLNWCREGVQSLADLTLAVIFENIKTFFSLLKYIPFQDRCKIRKILPLSFPLEVVICLEVRFWL